jgi:hypothetical protein
MPRLGGWHQASRNATPRSTRVLSTARRGVPGVIGYHAVEGRLHSRKEVSGVAVCRQSRGAFATILEADPHHVI